MSKKRKNKELTLEQWEEAKQTYATKKIGLRKLAKKFKTTYSIINTRYKNEKWYLLRKAQIIETKVTISEDAVKRSVTSAGVKDTEHQKIANDAVQVTRALLSMIAREMKPEEGKKTVIDPLAVQRAISALNVAINLERITHGLPTTIGKRDHTNNGESFNQQLTGVFEDEQIIKIAKDNGIDVTYIKKLIGRVVSNSDSEGQG